MLSIAAELVRRGGVVLIWARVYLQVLFGLASPRREHTARRSPDRGRSPQPWGLEARTVRRIGPRLVAFRLQLVIV